MTDTTSLPPPRPVSPVEARTEDKTLPVAIYALHLLFFVTGLSPIVGLIMAYVGRGQPETWRTSHYVFAIWTFWLAVAASAVACLMIVAGVPLLILFGLGLIPMVGGGLLLGAVAIWFVVRCCIGLAYAFRAEPYPRPRSLVI